MNQIFDRAAALRQMIHEAGLEVGDLSCNTNRDGNHSAYFWVEGGDRVRVSDHDTVCEDSYKWWAPVTAASVAAFVQRRRELMALAAERRDARIAAERVAAAARAAIYAEQNSKTDANQALLDAAELGHLIGSMRKTALRKLRAAAA